MPKKGKKGKKAAAEEAARLEAEQKAKEAEEKRKFEEQLVAREQAYDLGVPSCGGAFTPSTRLVSRNDGSGWSLFRIWGRSGRVRREMLRAGCYSEKSRSRSASRTPRPSRRILGPSSKVSTPR
jgi:hypothetical protein